MKITESPKVIVAARIAELVVLFIGVPLLYKFDIIPGPKFIPLFLVFVGCLIYLLRDKSFKNKHFRWNGFKNWKPMLLRFGISAVALTLYMIFFQPQNLFIIIRQKVWLWVLIFVFYPVWSAYPQELIYRAFFFHRYGSLFPDSRWLIAVNAILFSFLHIIFNNLVAVIATFFVGLLFAYTYQKSKSLLAVFVEHALYGNFVFTIGLGQYFYVPDF